MTIKQIFRDIRKDWLQFLAVFLMSFMCLVVYSALTSISVGMDQQASSFLKKTHLAETLLTADSLTSADSDAIEQLDGVKKVEPRLLLLGELLLDNHATIALTLTATTGTSMNQPLLVKGADYDSQDGLWLNKELIDHYQLHVGDQVTIELKGQQVTVPIAGSIQHPEYLFFPESSDSPYPNYKKTAYGFIPKNYLNQLLGVNLPDNQLMIKQATENFAWFQQESQTILGERYRLAVKTKELPQISDFLAKQEQVDKLALLFPFLFVILSSLTMASTMTRFIKKYQVPIGTYKAMGFKNSEIYRYYLSFGMVISGTGSLLGILCGPTIVAPLLISFLKKNYSIPTWETPIDTSVWLMTLLLVGCCILMTYLPCRQILKQLPANTLRIQMTSQVKPGLIEKSGLLNTLSFTNHWVARGILRNKSRSLMGIFGALGCTILLVAGIGINRSIHYTVDRTFNETNLYEEKIVFKAPIEPKEQQLLTETLNNQHFQWLTQQKIDLINGQNTVEKLVTIIDKDPLLDLVTADEKKVDLNELTENEVLLTHKLAKTLHARPGDTLYLKLQTETLFHPFSVKEIVSISSPQGIITTKEVWENAGYDYVPTSLLLKNELSHNQKNKITDLPFVKTTQLNKEDYQETLKTIQATIVIVSLIVFVAVFLGIVILSNFNLLIFAERFREFATLKVLGFKQAEIRQLSFRENFFLTLIGLGGGFIGGHYFLQAYVTIISPDTQEYLLQFGWQEYLIVGGITLSCSILINLFLDTMIRRISMAESLKSNE